MTPAFMQAHSRFQTFQEMFDQSPIADTTEQGAAEAFASTAWNDFVRKTTDFDGWEPMLRMATTAHLRLGEDD